jgi:hypothetical protein
VADGGCCRGEKYLKMILRISKKFVEKNFFCEFFQIFDAIFWACRIFLGDAVPPHQLPLVYSHLIMNKYIGP